MTRPCGTPPRRPSTPSSTQPPPGSRPGGSPKGPRTRTSPVLLVAGGKQEDVPLRVAKKVVTRYVVYNGKPPSRFVQVGGKKVPVTKATPGAVKLQEETGDYYGFWYEGGKEHQKRLCRDKKAAARMLSDYLTQKERSKVGLAKDPDQEARERAAATPDW